MAFSFENNVIYANSMSFDEFLKEETERLEEFILSSRREFHVDVDRYFDFSSHAITEEQLTERCAEVNIFLL